MDTKALRQKILDLAIRGKLVPQDPNDEPASVLLERIREQKKQMVKDGKLKPKDIKNDTIIFKGDDNLHYEKFSDGTVKCIEDEIPFDVPDNWKWVRIKTACVINPRNGIDDNTEVSFVPMANIKEGYANKFISDVRVWKKVKKGYTHFADNDIGIAKITPCFENKKSVVFSGLINGYGAGTTELYIVRTISSLVIPEYLLNFVKRDDFITGGVLTFSGDVGQQRVTKDYVANYLFTLPPLNEQQRILNAIHNANSLIESIEKSKDNLIRDIDRTKTKILDLAIRGKLVPQDPNDEPASVLLERIQAEKEELIKQGKIKRNKKESVIFKGDDNSYYEKFEDNTVQCIDNEIPFEVPNCWRWCRLSNVGTTNIGLTYKPIDIDTNGTIVLRSCNIKDGNILLNDLVRVNSHIRENQFIHEGDILICARNGSRDLIGKCAIMPQLSEKISFGAFMAVYRSICNRYVYYYFNTTLFRNSFSNDDSKQINQVTQAILHNMLIPLPPFEEQLRIVTKVKEIINLLNLIALDGDFN